MTSYRYRHIQRHQQPSLYSEKMKMKKCCLYDTPCNLEHILSSCNIARTQERYTWRHDKVIEKFAHLLELKRTFTNKGARKVKFSSSRQTKKQDISTKKNRLFSQSYRLGTRISEQENSSTLIKPHDPFNKHTLHYNIRNHSSMEVKKRRGI